MNKVFLFFILIFSMNVSAQSLEEIKCAVESPIISLASTIAGISEEQCRKNLEERDMLDQVTACLAGFRDTGVGTVEGTIDTFKMLIVDAPRWSLKKSQDNMFAVMGAVRGDLTPSQAAARMAGMNISSQESLWKAAQVRWSEIQKFSVELKNGLIKKVRSFPCKPLKEQQKIVCRAVSEVLLMAVGVGGVAKGASWGGKTAKALNNFLDALQKSEMAQKLPLAGRLDAAADALRGANKAQDSVRDVMTLRNATLREATLPDGQKVFQYHTKMKDIKTGELKDVIREVPVNNITGSIDARSKIGQEILEAQVREASGKGSVVFIDVNHLNRTNYFSGGMQTGDRYLSEVAESVRKSLRPGDMVYSRGGDELVVVLENNNPEIIRAISQRMINEVDKNPQVRQIFRNEVSAITNRYKEINRANNYDNLTDTTKLSLTNVERELARTNFTEFRRVKAAQLQEAFTDQARFRGSISVGSSLIRHGETSAAAFARAERQSGQVKAAYKAAHDIDVDAKYGIDANIETAISPLTQGRRGPPVALDPTP